MKMMEIPARRALRLITTKPTMIITTLNENGILNAGVFGAYTNLSPTEVGVAIGKGSHTYTNIKRTGEYVINIPSAEIVDSLSVIASPVPTSKSELTEAGLHPAPSKVVSASRIEECVASVELRFTREMEINHHSFVVGEAVLGWCVENLLDEEGYFDVAAARVLHDTRYPSPWYFLFGEVIKPE